MICGPQSSGLYAANAVGPIVSLAIGKHTAPGFQFDILSGGKIEIFVFLGIDINYSDTFEHRVCTRVQMKFFFSAACNARF